MIISCKLGVYRRCKNVKLGLEFRSQILGKELIGALIFLSRGLRRVLDLAEVFFFGQVLEKELP